MKTLIVWFLVSHGTDGILGFSPVFPSLQTCEQFTQVVYKDWPAHWPRGKCVQATIVNQATLANVK